jgi:thioredoxin reductase (NADPH)
MSVAVDCLVIGGGPAGLTAAVYLARFRLTVTVIDAGASRAALIPCSRNIPGFPQGVSGDELLRRMRDHAQRFGASIEDGKVDRLAALDQGFIAEFGDRAVAAKTVLLATGVTNRRPVMPEALHSIAIDSGRLRYCPVCDGFEVKDQKIAVIGSGAHGAKEAEFLRAYTSDVTLVAAESEHKLSPTLHQRLEQIGVKLVSGPATDFRLEDAGLSVESADGRLRFDVIYPALGSDAHSALGASVGADLTAEGCIKVDTHQRTSVAGLYAAGDVVVGLDQISHAAGEAGVAATAIRNDLAGVAPILRWSR